MLHPALGRLGFRIAIAVTLMSGLLLPTHKPGSAEFVLLTAALLIGLVFVLIIAVMVRWSRQHDRR